MLDQSAATVYSLSYIYTMDPKLLDSVTNIIKSKGSRWEPTCINVNTSSGTVNLMDYLVGGKGPLPTLLFDNAQLGSDPNDQINRKPIITKLRNACAEAGFELTCKGWEKGRKRMAFGCSRGRVFKSQKVSGTPREIKTIRPMEECEKCPFNFTVHWLEDSNCWALKSGNGCRFHVGHVQKEGTEVRKRISDFPEEQLEVIKDCLSTNVGSGAAASALLKERTGLNLSRGQLYRLGLHSQKVPPDDPSPEAGQGRKRNLDVYGAMNPLFQDLLKLAETDQEEFTYLHQGMKDLVAQSLQRLAIKKPRVTCNTI
jgi:hypothetical protein